MPHQCKGIFCTHTWKQIESCCLNKTFKEEVIFYVFYPRQEVRTHIFLPESFFGKDFYHGVFDVSFIDGEQQDWGRNRTAGMTACSRSVQTHPCGARCVMCDVWSVLCAAGWFFTCAGRAAGGKGVFLIDSNHSAVFFLFRRFLFAARRSVATPAVANFRGPLPLKIHGCNFDRGKGEKRKMILTFLPGCL